MRSFQNAFGFSNKRGEENQTQEAAKVSVAVRGSGGTGNFPKKEGGGWNTIILKKKSPPAKHHAEARAVANIQEEWKD